MTRRFDSAHSNSVLEMSHPVLGLDVGGVLVDRVSDRTDTSFMGNRPMETPAVKGSLTAVQRLVVHFGQRVHIISKAGPQVAGLTTRWLTVHGYIEEYFSSNGVETDGVQIPRTNLHYVRSRREKDPVAHALGITHFVDDRLDVLDNLSSVPHRFLFTGGLGSHTVPVDVPTGIVRVNDWSTLTEMILESLSAQDVH